MVLKKPGEFWETRFSGNRETRKKEIAKLAKFPKA